VGEPFGLSIVTPAMRRCQFDLGNVVAGAAIYINPYTAQRTDNPDPCPTIIAGIPLQIKHVNKNINRLGFTFNPTSCEPMSITGTITGGEGGSSAVSVPFQVVNCNRLQTITSNSLKQNEQPQRKRKSRHVKLVAPHEGPQVTTPGNASGTGTGTGSGSSGSSAQTEEANISRVKVDLPKQLPSRLTTLQKACTAVVFDANPAACPAASIVASAKAITPILPVPLEGPAYFVSHGNEAFPQLILVLQGYGITIDLVGDTFISKAGITSSTFAHVPDAPVSSFELTLPQGKFSALTANANLCTVKGGLKMPTEFVAQNGAVIHQSTPISVSGCPKAKTAAQLRAQKLAAALKACHKKHGSKRSGCEKTAHKRYNPLKKKPPKKK
jgi:hypothetical protein